MSRLECVGLTKRYGKFTALDRIDLKLEKGRVIGLLGPNGSGKTTFIKLANRLLTPQEGQILIEGMAPGPETKKIVSYLSDKNYLPAWMDVKTLLQFFKDFYEDFDSDRAREMLGNLGIEENMPLKKMSKGTKEKVQLILTMSRRAKLYLLDEPIAGVDPAARDYILRTIIGNYSEDATVLISTHLIADVESVLDEAIFLKQGRIVMHKSVDAVREETGKSVDEYFREVFRC
ncbi:MAG: ABC transporter ATP-binding protein [Lachnospiraceae bacterium]|nr:ABC transporter ATP-binding protein [Lachnospiraceae bacterium]